MIAGITASAQTAPPRRPSIAADDPSYSSVSVLLHGDGANTSKAIVDSSGYQWTVLGDAQITTTGPKFGAGSIAFDGAGDYLEIIRADLCGVADFTVEAWIYVTDHASDHSIFCVSDQAGNYSSFEILFETNVDGSLRSSVRTGSASNCDYNTPASAVPVATWTHVALTVEGTTARTRVNGVVVASAAMTGTRGNFPNTAARVGLLSPINGFGIPRWFKGRIDDLRVTRGVCRYPGAGPYPVPSAAFPRVPAPRFVSRFTVAGVSADAQGIVTDGVHVWFSSSSTIYKYTVAGALVTSRNVSGDNPTDKQQINGLALRGGVLHASAAKYVANLATSYVVQYDANTLAYQTHRQLPGDRFSEALAFYAGTWWAVFHATKEIVRYDADWNQIAAYPLTFTITGSSGGYGAGTGYDGLVWVDGLIYCNVHEIYDQDFLDVYAWNGAGFAEVRRLPRAMPYGSQGIALSPDGRTLWYAERNLSGTDAIAQCAFA